MLRVGVCIQCAAGFLFSLYKELIGLLSCRRSCTPVQSVSVWMPDHYTCALAHRSRFYFIQFFSTCGRTVGVDEKLRSTPSSTCSTVRQLTLITQLPRVHVRMSLWFVIDCKVKDAAVEGVVPHQWYACFQERSRKSIIVRLGFLVGLAAVIQTAEKWMWT